MIVNKFKSDIHYEKSISYTQKQFLLSDFKGNRLLIIKLILLDLNDLLKLIINEIMLSKAILIIIVSENLVKNER